MSSDLDHSPPRSGYRISGSDPRHRARDINARGITSVLDPSSYPLEGMPYDACLNITSCLAKRNSRNHILAPNVAPQLHKKQVDVHIKEDVNSSRAGTDADSSKLDSRKANKRSWLHDWWLCEIAGVTLSLAVMVATIGILLQYDGRLLSDWPYKITINAVISILSAIAKVNCQV